MPAERAAERTPGEISTTVDNDGALLLTVTMIHDWKGPPKVVPCFISEGGKEVCVVWGLEQCRLSVYTGRLVGNARRRMWRMHGKDLREVRKLVGWRPRAERCKLPP